MKFKFLVLVFSIFALTLSVLLSAREAKAGQKKVFSLPVSAKALSPNLYFLGNSKDADGREVSGYAYVHKKEGQAKGQKPGGAGPSCYGFMASGAKWKTAESWIINTSIQSGLNESNLLTSMNLNIGKWESAAGKTEIIGNGTQTNTTLEADSISPDNKNEVYFGAIDDPNTIGVTIVWGIFGGRPQGRELVEWDQIYNDVDYVWTDSGEPGKMDFENISTHELGHAFGMGDIYDSSCAEVTMFGYAGEGETKKRTLEQADIEGIKALYN